VEVVSAAAQYFIILLATLTVSNLSASLISPASILPSPDCIPRLSFLALRNVDFDNLNFPLRNVKALDIQGYGRWTDYPQLTTMLESSHYLENLILHVKAGVCSPRNRTHASRPISTSAPQPCGIHFRNGLQTELTCLSACLHVPNFRLGLCRRV